MENSFWDKLGGRKFVAFIVIVGAGIAVHVLSAKGVTAELTALFLGSLATFAGANALVTTKSMDASADTSPAPAAPPAPEPDPRIDSIVSAQSQTLESITEIQKVLVSALNSKRP